MLASRLPKEVIMLKHSDEWLRCADAGMIEGAEVIYKFGKLSGGMKSSYAPVTHDGLYRTPTVPVTLEAVSDSIEDDVGGTGGLTVTLEGIDENWERQKIEVQLNGLTPVAISGSWLRVYRVRLTGSNVYANQNASSHKGEITIREASAGQTWSTLPVESSFGVSTSLIGWFTVPKGYTAHIINEQLFTQSNRAVEIIVAEREQANKITSPYEPMKWNQIHYGSEGGHVSSPKGIGKELVGPCDIGYLAKSTANAATCAVMFQILLVKVY